MHELLTVVLATSNHGKIQELRALLADLPIQLVSAAEVLGEQPSIVEDGATFEANALIKARAIARATRTFALADDSGLEVDALGGRPGGVGVGPPVFVLAQGGEVLFLSGDDLVGHVPVLTVVSTGTH